MRASQVPPHQTLLEGPRFVPGGHCHVETGEGVAAIKFSHTTVVHEGPEFRSFRRSDMGLSLQSVGLD